VEHEDAFHMTLLKEVEARLAAHMAQQNEPDLGVRDRYLIPPELEMACLPDLVELASHQKLPPPPAWKVVKPLQQVLREKRRQRVEPAYFQDLDQTVSLSAAQLRANSMKMDLPELMELSEQAERIHRLRRPNSHLRRAEQELPWFGQKGGIFIPPTASGTDDWRSSKAYHFCRHMPVWQPERLEDSDLVTPDNAMIVQEQQIQRVCGDADVNEEAFERGLRNRLSRIEGVLQQVQNAVKSGVRKLYGRTLSGVDGLAEAIDSGGTGRVGGSSIIDALTRLGVAAPSDHLEELVNAAKDDRGQISVEVLKQAITMPKKYVQKIEEGLRRSFAKVASQSNSSPTSLHRSTGTSQPTDTESGAETLQGGRTESDEGDGEDEQPGSPAQAPGSPANAVYAPRTPTTMSLRLPSHKSSFANPARKLRPLSAASSCYSRARGPSSSTSATLSAFQKGQANTREGVLRRPHTARPPGADTPDIRTLRKQWCQSHDKVSKRPPWTTRGA